MKKKQLIKSGTSNYGRSYDGYTEGYDFPSAYYEAENYYYDEENDVETDERDYEADDFEYEEVIREATRIAVKHNIDLRSDSRDSSDPFYVTIESGYYDGIQTVVHDGLYEGDTDAEDKLIKDESYEELIDFFNELKENGWEVYL